MAIEHIIFTVLIVALIIAIYLFFRLLFSNPPFSHDKLTLDKGSCEGRHSCINLGKEFCHPIPEDGHDFIICNRYQKKNNEQYDI